jgi:hypothetical protein
MIRFYTIKPIAGWEPNKDRNTTNYIQPLQYNFKLDPLGCTWMIRDRIDLVIMQHSAARNFDIRMDNRNTWKKFDQRFEKGDTFMFCQSNIVPLNEALSPTRWQYQSQV